MARFYLIIVLAVIGIHAAEAASFNGYSISLGMEYNPIAKLDYENDSQIDLDVVDNITWEPGVYFSHPNGFRVGVIFAYYGKTIDRGDTRIAELSSWGVGVLGDYGYDMTESGKTFLVGGMEAGYGELTDKNEFAERTRGGVWIAGLGGIRYYFSRALSMEMDFRIKFLRYDFTEVPLKSYDFSGPTIRITLGYGIYSSKS
ncbi:MAG: outer membrane beta-barrel protein [candidate division Zixibacteria bacterium]